MKRFGMITAVALGASLFVASQAFAAGNAAQGKTFFTGVCAMCHNDTKGSGAKIGPDLYGVVGRKAGSVAGFAYSPAMKKAGFVWTEDKLAAYINNPQQVVPGNRMPYAGTQNMQKAENVAAYLATLK